MHKYLIALILIISGLCCKTQSKNTANEPVAKKEKSETKNIQPVQQSGSSYTLNMSCISRVEPDDSLYNQIVDLYGKTINRFPENYAVPISDKDSVKKIHYNYSVKNDAATGKLQCTPTNLQMTNGIPSQVYFYKDGDALVFEEFYAESKGSYYCKPIDTYGTQKSMIQILEDMNTWARPKKITFTSGPGGNQYNYEW